MPKEFRSYFKEEKTKKKPKKHIKKLSDKRAGQYKEYYNIRAEFLKDKICPITKQPATEVHHMKGKIGKLLCDERYFLGVTRTGHRWIEDHPEESYANGWSLSRNQIIKKIRHD